MSILDTLLNLVGLLLWLKWRDRGEEPLRGISLVATLKKPVNHFPRIWFLVGLIALLVVRSLLYWELGSELHWTPKIAFGIITLPFRSDFLGRSFVFSLFSFGAALGIFYLCIILLSILDDKKSQTDPLQILVRAQLGKIDVLPAGVKLVLPWLVFLVLWCGLHKPLVALGILPATASPLRIVEQGAISGLAIYLVWKYLIVALLLLHLLNSYIYFGSWPFWTFVDNAARGILKWISWIPLRVGKIDFAPVIEIFIVVVGCEFAARGLLWVYQRLPL